jgi:hypothetical protein
MQGYLILWLLTVVIEFIIIWAFIRDKPLKLLFYSFLINSFTLPIATYSYINIISNWLIVEICVTLAESVILKLLLETKYRNALLISTAANSATALLGLLLSFY